MHLKGWLTTLSTLGKLVMTRSRLTGGPKDVSEDLILPECPAGVAKAPGAARPGLAGPVAAITIATSTTLDPRASDESLASGTGSGRSSQRKESTRGSTERSL